MTRDRKPESPGWICSTCGAENLHTTGRLSCRVCHRGKGRDPLPMRESQPRIVVEPWIWLNDDEDEGIATCGCRLVRDYQGGGPALFACRAAGHDVRPVAGEEVKP